MDADQQEVKRLKFSKEEDDEEEEEEEEEEQEVETLRPSHVACVSKEADAMVHEEDEVEYSKEREASTSAPTSEDQGEAGASFSFLTVLLQRVHHTFSSSISSIC